MRTTRDKSLKMKEQKIIANSVPLVILLGCGLFFDYPKLFVSFALLADAVYLSYVGFYFFKLSKNEKMRTNKASVDELLEIETKWQK